MKPKGKPSSAAAELRRKAEEQLRTQKTKKGPGTEQDTQRLLHELQVHQIELEMQNEELKQARVAVEAALKLYTDLYDFAPVGYFTLGRDSAICQANLTGASLLGVERSKLVRRKLARFVAPDESGHWDQHFQSVLQSAAKQACELTFKRADGATLLARLESICLDRPAQQAPGGDSSPVIRVAMTDISEQKRAEAQYRQAQKMETVGRLAAGVAHDFNNQLTVILGYADMFLSEGRKDDPLWEPMTQIRQAARRAHSTTSHLLSFSRKQILAAELVDLREFLKETEMPVSRMLGEDIRLIVAVDPDCPPVFVDKSGLHQAIMNIVVNARDAMPNGGELVLQASRFNLASANATEFAEAAPGTYVLLEVIDTGAGMDGQTLEHAFEPFFTTKEQGKGTGLGLPMVMGFVGQSHGFVGIKSEPGKGTIVRLLFPPAEDKVADDHEPPVSPPVDMHKDKTIAVIEDEEGVRLFLVNALKQSGYRVLAAAGPGECLKLLKDYNGPLDLVISDMIMPEMRGDELARRLKASSPELPVLFITGYAEQCSLAEGELLRKPFDVDDLLARVQSLTSKRAVGENETQA